MIKKSSKVFVVCYFVGYVFLAGQILYAKTPSAFKGSLGTLTPGAYARDDIAKKEVESVTPQAKNWNGESGSRAVASDPNSDYQSDQIDNIEKINKRKDSSIL